MVVRRRPRTPAARSRSPKQASPAVVPPPVAVVPPPGPEAFSPLHVEPRPPSYEEAPESHGSWLRRHTSFAASLLFHLLLLIGLALWSIAEPTEDEPIVLLSDPPVPLVDDVVSIEPPAESPLTLDDIAVPSGGDLNDLATMLDPVHVGEANADAEQDVGQAPELFAADELMQALGGGQAGGGIGPGLNEGNMMQFVERLRRAGAKGGDVQVSLAWDNFNDLDLHVITPRGENIFFGRRRSRDRGELDVDMNAGVATTREPVENIYWAKGKAPLGKFKVLVHHYHNHGDPDPTEFEVRIVVDGQTTIVHGSTSFGEPRQLVYEFERKASTRGGASAAETFPTAGLSVAHGGR
jgi:hypothetical protein